LYNSLLGPSDTYTCCPAEQIATMADQFGMAKLMLGRCPSCYHNFRSLFCAMTCSPYQSRFLTVKDIGPSTIDPNKTSVLSIYYNLADDFAERLLDSCRLV
jgi:hypothetical protein